jgi:NADPH-dependent 2,4-dienoyl-CoA reductase/sulfur reductase-like enzyme
MSPRTVLVVGGSTAGATAMRELRRRGHDGPLTLLDPEDGTNRPPLSKAVLADPGAEDAVTMDHAALDVDHVRSTATALDPEARVVTDAEGRRHRYDALLVATGGRARRLAAPGQRGERVLRTVDDARGVRDALAGAASVVVVGAGFLGLEVGTAARRTGAAVTVVDPDPPLTRLVGQHLAGLLLDRAVALGIAFERSTVRLHGDPVSGVLLPDGRVLDADVVVTCAGDVPEVGWLTGTVLADPRGVLVDADARTAVEGVWAAGDVARAEHDGSSARRPFWANAVAQGRVAAASILGQEVDAPIVDHYAWTEVAGTSLKVVGVLPCDGEPEVLEARDDGGLLLAWGPDTVVAVGLKRSVPSLRRLLEERPRP